uniref:Uncharacterized protein n=1 Tax=Setaria viridis TaxID=4556 RepID=A0A4U6T5R4_SETVI|nr:hypothetical protein SEVIR_9G386850v2 [Setaria viridis]TKV95818.1 hypothetical protein SEVIR_9G386850v2 [Setaria viridis]
MGSLMLACNFIIKISCIVSLSKGSHILTVTCIHRIVVTCIHHIVEPEVHEVVFVECI